MEEDSREAYIAGLIIGWSSRLEQISKTTDNEGILQLIEDMKKLGKSMAVESGVIFND